MLKRPDRLGRSLYALNIDFSTHRFSPYSPDNMRVALINIQREYILFDGVIYHSQSGRHFMRLAESVFD
jgi:hypothetical protein